MVRLVAAGFRPVGVDDPSSADAVTGRIMAGAHAPPNDNHFDTVAVRGVETRAAADGGGGRRWVQRAERDEGIAEGGREGTWRGRQGADGDEGRTALCFYDCRNLSPDVYCLPLTDGVVVGA